MSEQVHVKSLQALAELRNSLGQFRNESCQSLDFVNREIRRFEEWMRERQRYWQYHIEEAQEMIYQAQRDLEECEASGYYDDETGDYDAPDCRCHEEQLAEAYRRLREAEEELQNVNHWRNVVEGAVHDYQRQARRLADQLNNTLPQAGAFLGKKLAILEAYRAEQAPSGGDVSAVPSSSTSSSTGHTASYGSGNASCSQSISAGSSGGTSQSSSTGAWKEHGFHNVSVQHLSAAIKNSDSHVTSKADFKKVSYDDMVDGFRKLQEVILPAVQNEADGEYFSDMDARQGLDNEHGYRRIYDAFYGDDAIRVNKTGDEYDVINGYHRLFVAKELGLETIPVKLVERESKE